MNKQFAISIAVVTLMTFGNAAHAQRVDVWRMSPQLRHAIAVEVYRYISPQNVGEHARMFDTGMHRDGKMFMDMHRDMIRMLEQHLAMRGLPMPIWNPATPIPPEFRYVKRVGQPIWWINNANPRIPLTSREVYWVRNARNEWQLGQALMPWHNAVHNAVGGAMSQPYSPSAVIFWAWHGYVDGLYCQWEANRR